MDLDLVAYTDGSSQQDVDFLFGLDQYWDLATGEVQCGQSGPVAINMKLEGLTPSFDYPLQPLCETLSWAAILTPARSQGAAGI